MPVDWLEAVAEAAPAQGLGVSFDDGNISDIELALPILLRHGLTARFFILAGRIGMPGYLGRAEIRELRAAGMAIGSHGINHRDWSAIEPGELRAETEDSRKVLGELLGEPVTEIACPFGRFDRRVLRAVWAAGYERLYTTEGGPGVRGWRVMPRTSVARVRELEHWVGLAAGAGGAGPGFIQRARRRAKGLV